MQYILLIYSDEKQNQAAMAKATEEEQKAYMAAWFGYTEEMQKAGAYVAGDALQDTGTDPGTAQVTGTVRLTESPAATPLNTWGDWATPSTVQVTVRSAASISTRYSAVKSDGTSTTDIAASSDGVVTAAAICRSIVTAHWPVSA